MSSAIFGGGFFFQSFTQSIVDLTAIPAPGTGLANYGVWTELTPATPRGRWVQLDVPQVNNFNVALINIQFGIGPAGLEVLFQPTGGDLGAFQFRCNLSTVTGHYSFPTTMPGNVRLCARASSNHALVTSITLITCVWG